MSMKFKESHIITHDIPQFVWNSTARISILTIPQNSMKFQTCTVQLVDSLRFDGMSFLTQNSKSVSNFLVLFAMK